MSRSGGSSDELALDMAIARSPSITRSKDWAFPAQTYSAENLAVFFGKIHEELFADTQKPLNLESIDGIGIAFSIVAEQLQRASESSEAGRDKAVMQALAISQGALLSVTKEDPEANLTIRTFLVKAAQALTGREDALDFSKLDRRTPEEPVSAFETITSVLLHCCSSRRVYNVGVSSEYKEQKEAAFYPDGVTVQRIGNNLLTFDGGLVPKYKVDAFLNNGGIIEDFEISRSEIPEYLKAECRERKDVDGVPVGSRVKLFRLDEDFLTGLNPSDLQKFNDFEKQATTQKIIKYTTGVPDRIEELRRFAESTGFDIRILEKAYQRLRHTAPMVIAEVEKGLDGKTPTDSPMAYFPTGGCGSGKGRLFTQVANPECEDNIVFASLDEGRKAFKQVWSYDIGHDIDYDPYLAKAGNLVRQMLFEQSLEQGFNVFRDGTGVPASDKLIRQAKASGLATSVLCVTAPLIGDDNIFERVASRGKEDGRSVPPSIVSAKNVGAARAFNKYRVMPKAGILDDWRLYDNSGSREDFHLIAQNKVVTREERGLLLDAKRSGGLKDLVRSQFVPRGTRLGEDVGILPVSDNVVTVIYDMAAFKKSIKRAQMNAFAQDACEITVNTMLAIATTTAALLPLHDITSRL